jgi:hypothetical protein
MRFLAWQIRRFACASARLRPHLEEVGDGLVEAFGPEMRSDLRFEELDVDAHAISRPLRAAFKDIADVELAPKRDSDCVQSMSISTFEPA